MSLPPSSITDLSDFPELPPMPWQQSSDGVPEETAPEPEPVIAIPEAPEEESPKPRKKPHRSTKELSVEEAILLLDPPAPGKKIRMTKNRKLEMGLLDVGEKEIKQELFNHHKIRLAAQKRVLKALNALDRVLDEDGDLYAIATPAQVLKAAEIVLDRAGDKPATAPAGGNEENQHALILDKSVMPSPSKK